MTQKLTLLIGAMCLFCGTTLAQITVRGLVSDNDGQPLIGVNILEEGTDNGTITDLDGRYELLVQEGATLTFSYTGYSTQNVQVGNQTELDLTMKPGLVLDEVVVTALGISREKKSLGYAVSEVAGSELVAAREPNVVNSLNGRVAGLQITQTASGAAGSNRVIIRGNNSISGNNQPLYVVDGVPIQNQSNAGGADEWGNGIDLGNAISDINPDDIESVSVLKGPNAAALYGSLAANGVILITTKKGTVRKGIGVSLRSNYTWDNVLVTPDLQNQYGQGTQGTVPNDLNVLKATLGSWGARMDGSEQLLWTGERGPYTAQPNNYQDFFQTGSTWTNSVALDGGSEKATFRLGYTNVNNEGIVPNSELNRNSVTLRSTLKLTERLRADAKITYVNQRVQNRPRLAGWGDNPVLNLLQMARNVSLSDLQNFENPDGSINIPFNGYGNNPYHTINRTGTEDTRNRIIGFASLNYDFGKGFSALARVGTDFANQSFLGFQAQNHPFVGGGRVEENQYNNQFTSYDGLISYDGKVGFLGIGLNAGGSIQRTYNKSLLITGDGLTVDGIYNVNNTASRNSSTFVSEKIVRSLYASGQFAFGNYAFLDWTVRNDWSSALPADNRSYFYPSVSLSGILSEAIDATWLDFWKVRASWAQVGIDGAPYQDQLTYSTQPSYLGNPVLRLPNTQPALDLKPEITASFELGTEINFFLNRLGIDFTYYDATTRNQILSIPVPTESGYAFKVINAGKVRNSGIELMLTGGVVRTKDFSWDLTLNLARNRTQVLELEPDFGIFEQALAPITGNTPFSIKAVADGGYGEIWGFGYERDEQGRIVVDEEGVPFASGEFQKLGNFNPNFTAGLSSNFRWKEFGINFLINGQNGGDILSLTDLYLDGNGNSVRTLEGRDGGLVVPNSVNREGQPNNTTVSAQDYFGGLASRSILEDYVYDASYIKFKELSVSYSLPKRLLEKTALNRVTFSLVGRNLFFISRNTDNFDPETASYNSRNAQGIEFYSLPGTRSIGLDLNLQF